MKKVFYETQKFDAKWMVFIYALLVALLALFIYADISQIVLKHPFGTQPVSNMVLVFSTVLIVVIIYLFYAVELQTKITEDGVFFRWTIFQKSFASIKWTDVESFEIYKYNFVGYGFRLVWKGTVHNVKGYIGLRLLLKSGKTITLGTQKAEELRSFLQELQPLKQH